MFLLLFRYPKKSQFGTPVLIRGSQGLIITLEDISRVSKWLFEFWRLPRVSLSRYHVNCVLTLLPLSVVTLMLLSQPDVLMSRHWLCVYMNLWSLWLLKMREVINSNEYLVDTVFENSNSESFVPRDSFMLLKLIENSKVFSFVGGLHW